jgi:hypothetical protein
MFLIIDINVIPKVFNYKHRDHAHYAEVNKCLFECEGKMLFGGTTFIDELQEFKKESYINIFNDLKRKNKWIELDIAEVNLEEKKIYAIQSKGQFNDAHLIACIVVSYKKNCACKVVCSEDKNADKYLTDKKFYSSSKHVPSIYRNKSDKHLLAECC